MENKTATPVVYLPASSLQQDDEIDLIAIWRTLWRWKWFIVGITLICSILAVYITLYRLPVLYKSEAVLQPTLSQDSLGSFRATLGKLSQFISLPPTSGGNKSQLIVNYLQSRTLKSWMIKEFNLLPRFYYNDWDHEKKTWRSEKPEDIPTIIKAIQTKKVDEFYSVKNDDKSGLINLSFVDRDPAFASKVLNGVSKELKRYLDHDYITDAKRNRIFVETQVARAKEEIEYWERQMPDANHSASEILREQQAALAAYTELRAQYELARVEEAAELIAFKVLDEPFIPDKKYKPKRTMICALTFLVSLFLSVLAVFFIEFIRNAGKQEMESEPLSPNEAAPDTA